MPESTETPTVIDEPKYRVKELARKLNLDEATVQKLFLDEPGVIRYGHPGSRTKRQYFTLIIPKSVAERVFRRLTV